MGAKNSYPEWKTWAWRFLRAGVAGGISMASVLAVAVKPDLSNVKYASIVVGGAFVAGFINAVGLMVRDLFASKSDMTDWVHKLPV